jgi:hypothetical protein
MPLSESIVSRLQYQHQSIVTLTAVFTEEELKRRPIPEKWSAFENIAHLCAYQPIFLNRISLILNESNPLFEPCIAEKDPVFEECLTLSLPQLISKATEDRAAIKNKLGNLSVVELCRSARHPKYGKLDIPQWAEFFLLHEAHHLWTVLKLTYSMLKIA